MDDCKKSWSEKNVMLRVMKILKFYQSRNAAFFDDFNLFALKMSFQHKSFLLSVKNFVANFAHGVVNKAAFSKTFS